MGTTTTPAFHAMSVDELEHSRTALEIKIASLETADKTWILGRFDDLIGQVKADTPTTVTIDRATLTTKLDAGTLDYEARTWVLALFDELTDRVEDRATD